MAIEMPMPPPPPRPEGPVHWGPSPGMAISTLKVTRSQDAYVAVEHPEGWGEAEILAAVHARLLDLGKKIDWWDADSTSSVDGVAVGENDPDNPHCEPFSLTIADAQAGQGMAMQPPAPGAAMHAVGHRVRVIGEPHMEGQDTGTVEIVSAEPVYGIRFDGDAGVHKWYVESEIESIDEMVSDMEGE